ncbi:MAG: response regulator transcription factor [Chloroflexi bacterium]|nr:response regulator transcription factor [Chloroflexota bacterium]
MSFSLLLVDDHPLFLEGLQNLLTARGIKVLGTARDGIEALEKARALHPDMILMDVRMPRTNGLAATRLIKTELPEIKIVMLTTSEAEADLFEAVKSGASGYLLKTIEGPKFFDSLEGLQAGEVYVSPELATKLLEEFTRQAEHVQAYDEGEENVTLTARQKEVLTLVAQGLAYKEVAGALGLSEHTIKYHMGDILERLHLKNRKEVVAYAVRTGLVKDRRKDSR